MNYNRLLFVFFSFLFFVSQGEIRANEGGFGKIKTFLTGVFVGSAVTVGIGSYFFLQKRSNKLTPADRVVLLEEASWTLGCAILHAKKRGCGLGESKNICAKINARLRDIDLKNIPTEELELARQTAAQHRLDIDVKNSKNTFFDDLVDHCKRKGFRFGDRIAYGSKGTDLSFQ